MSGDTSSVQVAVRVRPMLASEAGSTPCIEVLQSSPELPTNVIRIGGVDGPTFAFDQAFDGNCHQSHVFDHRVVPLVEQVLEGYNATILAYGQTGSGKTYSVMGPSTALQDGETAGIIPRAMRNLFQLLREKKEASVESSGAQLESSDAEDSPFGYEIRVQFLEIYGEEIRDLLAAQSTAQRLTVRDVGMEEPEVLGASQHKVETAEEALLCLTRGMLRRVTGETAMNASSSRSHAIMSVMVQQTVKHGDNNDQLTEVKRSKFNFVDLAGSERQKRTKAEGRRLKEGIDINRGLLVLGNVISALGDPKRHGTFVPYRDSKLTRLLKGSLGGNHKTLMIACVSPSSTNLDESLNCLRYANRAKNIQNKAVVNVDAGSRLVAELRGQVQALATELLRVREGCEPSDESFSFDMLKSMVGDGMVKGGGVFTPITSSASKRPLVTPSASSAQSAFQPTASLRQQQDLLDVKRALAAAQSDLQSTTEDLFTVRAEKEMYRLRLDAQGSSSDDGVQAAFVEKAAAYEREIATLREAVTKNTDPIVVQATLSVTRDRERLRQLQNAASAPQTLKPTKVPIVNERNPGEQLDIEERAEQDEIGTITRKFLDDDEFDEHTLDLPKETGSHEASSDIRQQQIEASLSDLSRNIDEKELLIQQLQASRDRYASMKEFYEAKLAEMEVQVREREQEREALVAELAKLEQSNSDTKEMQEKLSRKDTQIAGLRKRHKELTSLTKVSSRNEQQIARLRDEVAAMKQKKVELQKMVTHDRREHLKEIQRLKKEALRKDREAVKWKRVSDKKEREANKAQQFAKAQTEQVGQLRAKYKEAERKLRVRTVKRGVMAKAGLDAVIVGRRIKPPSVRSRQSRGQSSNQGSPGKKAELDVDAMRDFLDQQVSVIGRKESLADKLANEWEDHMDLLDQKEKILQDASNNGDSTEAEASVEAIDVKLRYKEARIRQLAARLGKKPNDGDGKSSKDATNFLDIREFRALFPGVPQMEATRLACRILFGMVVRERRRVASLARTASGLDAKILEAQRATVAKDAAMRAYMEEESHERATLAQSQQEQILSLMALVQDQESSPDTEIDGNTTSTGNREVMSNVMILANERIEALEKALREHEGERKAMQLYKEREEEAVAALQAVQDDCQKLHVNMDSLVISMRSIREAVISSSAEEATDEFSGPKVLGIISRALNATKQSMEERDLAIQASNTDLTPSPCLTHRSQALHSDSDDDEVEEEIPEWAGDIMADLQTIADGGVPQSLLDSPSFRDYEEEQKERSTSSVFDRLTNPKNFTGVQKRKTASKMQQRNSRVKPGSNERKEVAKKGEKSLDRVVLSPDMKSPSEDGKRDTAVKEKSKAKPKASGSPAESGDRRSVFERLVSPSAYTGTQKERIKKSMHPRTDVQDNGGQVDELLNELLGRGDSCDVFPADRHSEPSITSQVESKMADYTQQNVFERLQRTTTQSYAGKHGGTPARAISSPSRSQMIATHVELDPARSISPQVPEYIRQNVFERLQKTTTQAYAQKSNQGTSS